MKNLIALFIFGTIVAGGIIAYKTPFSYCDNPRTYKLGSIDPRFNLKRDTAIADIDKALSILDSAYGKKLFEYATSSGELTLNFIYDERSALELNINSQESKLSKAEDSIQEKINQYETDFNKFIQKLNAFNETIQKYNSEGGAPPEVYDTLINQQNQLKSEGDALNTRAKQLRLETHDFNSNVEDLSQDISAFNKALSQKPEEGLYDGANKTITIYFVSSKPELIHTLTHEFGHAVGMGHVENPSAIMYPQTSETLQMTDVDKQELNKACQSFPLPEYWLFKTRLEIFEFMKNLPI